MGNISSEEEVGMEIGGGLCRQSCTESVDVVTGEDGVDRPDVDLRGMILGTCLDEILDQGLESEDDILKTLDLLQASDKVVH